MNIKYFLLLLIIGTSAVCYGERVDSILRQLDKAVAHRQEYENARILTIKAKTADLRNAETLEDKYNVLRDLFAEYRSYRIDSAIYFADRRLQIAREMGDPAKIVSATLNLAEGYTKAGDADKAIAILDTLSTESEQDYHKKYKNRIYRTAYSTKVSTALLNSDRILALDRLKHFTEELENNSKPGSIGDYFFKAEKLKEKGMHKEAVTIIKEVEEKFDFSDDAPNQFTVGEIYYAAGDKEKAKMYLARSAYLDITGGVKEYRALILLASILFEEGEIDRAFEYINCAFEDAEFSKASLRTPEIMKSMPVIDASFHIAERKINQRTKIFLLIASVLVVLLIGLLVWTIKQNRLNRKMLKTIEDINGQLADKNEMLKTGDSLKLRYINTLLLAYAGHISRFRDYRKMVYRLLKASQYEKAIEVVRSDKVETEDINDFHKLFDESFLSMFPDFIEEINKFMNNPVHLRTPGQLTPELRVCAMMRLGINSTEDIALMLHYSLQTIYNLRSSLKSMVSNHKKDFENYLKGS